MHAMQSSASEHSYARNSGAQNYSFHAVAKPRLRNAIKHLAVCKSASLDRVPDGDHVCAGAIVSPRLHFAIADLGCAHGRNTLDCAEFVVPALLEDHVSSNNNCTIKEVQYFFSDLPSNDFNALFRSLEPYSQQSVDSGTATLPAKFFAAGVPGSFYGRLFVKASLDLVICCTALHWLSQVPPSVVDKASPSWNGGHTWISKAEPSKAVADAYAQQSERDVKRFLRCRAEELASGGVLFLFWVARSSYTRTEGNKNDCVPFEHTLEFLDYAWKEMVDEGLIASEEMDMLNIGLYFFNEEELESAVKDVPELRVLHMETIKDVTMYPEQGRWGRRERVEEWGNTLASALKGAVEAHVGKSKADKFFEKLKSNGFRQDCFDACLTLTHVVASLQRL